MRIPVPRNRLVAFTLAGALLTAIVAGALVAPGGLAQADDQTDAAGTAASGASQPSAADSPTPNQHFTPAVQSQPGPGDDDEYEAEYGEGEEHEAEE